VHQSAQPNERATKNIMSWPIAFNALPDGCERCPIAAGFPSMEGVLAAKGYLTNQLAISREMCDFSTT
jgi:hypothetical protein